MEFTFHIAAHIVFCFAFVAETVFITQQSHYCWTAFVQYRDFLSFPFSPIPTLTMSRLRWASVRRGQSWHLTWNDQRDIPYLMMLGYQEKECVSASWLQCFSSQATIMCAEAMFPRMWLDICLLIGSNKLISYFALLAYIVFTYANNLSSPPTNESSCLPSTFSSSCRIEEWKSGCVRFWLLFSKTWLSFVSLS